MPREFRPEICIQLRLPESAHHSMSDTRPLKKGRPQAPANPHLYRKFTEISVSRAIDPRKISPRHAKFSRRRSPIAFGRSKSRAQHGDFRFPKPLTRAIRARKPVGQRLQRDSAHLVPQTLTFRRRTQNVCSRSHSRSFPTGLTGHPEPLHSRLPRILTMLPVKFHLIGRKAISSKGSAWR